MLFLILQYDPLLITELKACYLIHNHIMTKSSMTWSQLDLILKRNQESQMLQLPRNMSLFLTNSDMKIG